jgi:CheY-like chemotaxis protein
MMAVAEDLAWGVVNETGSRVSTEQIRLLVVDDHTAVRRGLRELLEDQQDFRVIDAVPSAEEAMSVAERAELDVAVVDYQLGGRNGLWVSRKLKHLPRPLRVVIYSAYCDGVLAAAAVVAEADGLVSKVVVADGPVAVGPADASPPRRRGAGDLRDVACGDPAGRDREDVGDFRVWLGVSDVGDVGEAREH